MNDAPLVTFRAGTVRGLWRGEPGTPGRSAAFLGIPFAAPPVGDRRFDAPQPASAWAGVRDATTFGATPQRRSFSDETLIPEPSIPGEGTLNVNVFTPRPGEDAGLPVLVWFHGGGYIAGSPASPWYDGAGFARDGVVTVTASYRLGFDGFGVIDGAPTNRAVRDWIAALEWVRENIRAFGGDPARVTIAGQSAGAGAVLRLLALPAAQHLFHGVWASSPALVDTSLDRARLVGVRLAELGGVAATADGLRTLPEERVSQLQEKAGAPERTDGLAEMRAMLTEGLPWGPVVDGDLVPQTTLEALHAGVGADKALVVGANDDEFTMVTDGLRGKLRLLPVSFVLGKLGLPRDRRASYLADNRDLRERGTAGRVGRYVGDRVFRRTVAAVAAAREDAPTWTYRLSWASPGLGWACHCLDVPFFFACADRDDTVRLLGPTPPTGLVDDVHGAAVALISAGDPGWQRDTAADPATRIFDHPAPSEGTVPDGYAAVRALL